MHMASEKGIPDRYVFTGVFSPRRLARNPYELQTGAAITAIEDFLGCSFLLILLLLCVLLFSLLLLVSTLFTPKWLRRPSSSQLAATRSF